MMRGHVFIVDYKTLPTHLKYMFVGTGAGDNDKHPSLLADMLRVKKDDFIFFYIQRKDNKDGRLFGTFKATDNDVYHAKGRRAFAPELGDMKLIYRKRIKPYEIYPRGIVEWEALDKLPCYAKELLWSLIYRKLKGTRGNTMLFPWETERLISLIANENTGKAIAHDAYTFNNNSFEIINGEDNQTYDLGSAVVLTPEDISMAEKKKREAYFQAFITNSLNTTPNSFLTQIFGQHLVWIGNEVFAGLGMRKVDIITIERMNETSHSYRLIELKYFEPGKNSGVNQAPSQLEYYVNWAREDIGGHIIGSKKFNIKPILLSLMTELGGTPKNLLPKMEKLRGIADNPEIWEINYKLETNKVL